MASGIEDMTLEEQVELWIQLLRKRRVCFERGLSDWELENIELEFGFNFPPDLRLFLHHVLPVSPGFVEWRAALYSMRGRREALDRLRWPLEGMWFDVKENSFWDERWGVKPSTCGEQIRCVVSNYKKMPPLIPVYSHRYLPSIPCEVGNPVYSVYQMDIVYYGSDLSDYFRREFNLYFPKDWIFLEKPKEIEYWSEFIG